MSENPEPLSYHWYATDFPRTQYYQMIPYNTWNPLNGAAPVPVFDVDGLEIDVTVAGSPEVNGTYRFVGTLNGAYLFEQQP